MASNYGKLRDSVYSRELKNAKAEGYADVMNVAETPGGARPAAEEIAHDKANNAVKRQKSIDSNLNKRIAKARKERQEQKRIEALKQASEEADNSGKPLSEILEPKQ